MRTSASTQKTSIDSQDAHRNEAPVKLSFVFTAKSFIIDHPQAPVAQEERALRDAFAQDRYRSGNSWPGPMGSRFLREDGSKWITQGWSIF